MNEYDYIIDAFTLDGDNTNLEVDNLTVGCIESKNNNFSLDSNGNLTVNSITTSGGGIDFDRIYPVGSVYISVVNTNPSTLFGGTWEAINGKFLLSSDNSHAAGTTGGNETISLVANNLPSHNHSVNINTNGAGSHSHSSATQQCMEGTPSNNYTVMRPYGWGSGPDGTLQGTNVVSNHTHNVNGNTGNTGNGQAINNMPPFLTVYMWKRTM